MLRHQVASSVFAGAALLAQAQHQVVPAAYATQDAVSYQWIAGASRDVRQQTLIGPSHLQNLQQRTITALELRRTAADEPYSGGTAAMTVTLSTSPRTPLTASPAFAGNHGPDAVQVFAGQVTLPSSPATTAGVVPWDASHTVRIALQQPFVYHGGTLCIDVVGTAIPGQTADWWMADAEFEDLAGTATELGGGCGPFGSRWSFVSPRTLLVGAPAHFWAHGPGGGLGVAVFGQGVGSGIPLTSFGLPAPGCDCHVLPASVLTAEVALFVPEPDPRMASRGGTADLFFQIPNLPVLYNLTLTTQWLELATPALSNAIEWTVAGVAPTLDMALVEGLPSMATGNVSVHLAHVWRLEHQ